MSFNRDRPRESFTVTCGDCGNECQIPFKPRDARPVYCRECFQKHKPQQSGGSRFGGGSRFNRNDRGSSYGGRSNYGRDSRNDGPKEMFDAKCADCGNDCQIPFRPRGDKPVYCRECFQDHKPEQRSESRYGGRSSYGGHSGGGRSSYGGRSGGGRSSYGRGRGDREMFTATCGDCGKECQIPFRPRENRPVYCNECFSDHRN